MREAGGGGYLGDRAVAQAGQDRRGELLRVNGRALIGSDGVLMVAVLRASELCGSAAVSWVLALVAEAG